MGIFSSIGSLFGPVGMVVGALADTSMAKKEQQKANAAKEAAYQRQLEAERLEAEKNRALAKSDAATKFTDMSAAAQKAGINPLTALRTTGGAGFGNYGGFASQAVAPVLSKFSFARSFASNVGKSYFENKINEPIDKYNKQIRDLELQQRKADLKMTRASYGAMTKKQMEGPSSLPLFGLGGKPITTTGGQQVYVSSTAAEAVPMYIPVYDQSTGETFAMPNPELLEAGPAEVATGYGMIAAAKKAAESGIPIKTPLGTFDTDPLDLSYGQLSTGMPIGLPATSF